MYSLCLEMLLPYQLPTGMKVGACFLCFLEQIVVGRTGMETLTNEAGEVTRYTNISQDAVTMFLELVFFLIYYLFPSHLQGMFNRTIRLLEAGIKPV